MSLPYPIEEMRKFIEREHPNNHDFTHPDYKAGALMAAIIRWWQDEYEATAMMRFERGDADILENMAERYSMSCPDGKKCDVCSQERGLLSRMAKIARSGKAKTNTAIQKFIEGE